MQALKGVRILDMTHVQAGPTASQLMAWMGADVIKFENPQGDATRGQLRDVPNADSLYFTMLNCNKRSITVNMKSAEGKQVFVDLLKKCDIMMENFGPGVLERLGFTWEKIHEINPKIVVGSIKGFGSSGPYSDFKAYENVAQAMGGVRIVKTYVAERRERHAEEFFDDLDALVQEIPLPAQNRVTDFQDGLLTLLDVLHQLDG